MKAFLFFAVLLGGIRGLAQPAGYAIFNRNFTIDAGGVAHMNEAPGDGIAWINGQRFSVGTIELDIRGKDAFQQSFVGIAHGVDDSTPDPGRVLHAVQYVAPPGLERSIHHYKKINHPYEERTAGLFWLVTVFTSRSEF
jgi:hypothetical protein